MALFKTRKLGAAPTGKAPALPLRVAADVSRRPVLSRLKPGPGIALVLVFAFIVFGLTKIITSNRAENDFDRPQDRKVVAAVVLPSPVDLTRVSKNSPTVAASPAADRIGKSGTSSHPEDSSPKEVISPSFDCNKARSTAEALICADSELAEMDVHIAYLHGKAKAAAADKKDFASRTTGALTWRDKNCREKACLVSWYAEREGELNIKLAQQQLAR